MTMDLKDQLRQLFPEHEPEMPEGPDQERDPLWFKRTLYYANMKKEKGNRLPSSPATRARTVILKNWQKPKDQIKCWREL